MTRTKRLLALVMAAMMVLSLAGCGAAGTAQSRPEQNRPILQQPQRPKTAPTTTFSG